MWWNVTGIVQFGLLANPTAISREECQTTCENQGSFCTTYLFNSVEGPPAGGCWLGNSGTWIPSPDVPTSLCTDGTAKIGWAGGSKLPPPPSGERVPARTLIAIASAALHKTGTPSFVTSIPVRTWTMSSLPVTPGLPADDPARTVFFSEGALDLTFWPVNTAAWYELELTFLDDTSVGIPGRVETISIGRYKTTTYSSPGTTVPGCSLQINIPLNRTKGVHRYKLPRTAVQVVESNSSLTAISISITKTTGANVVLSSARLFSSDTNASTLTPRGALPPPPPPPLPNVTTPRISPKPTFVAGVQTPVLSLNSEHETSTEWSFDPSPINVSVQPSHIFVPGEYTLQGFRVPTGTRVRYARTVTLPQDWCTSKSRIKLRFDGCYSKCTVSWNGNIIGTPHMGGFTPFELDVTGSANVTCSTGSNKENFLVVDLIGRGTLADTLASASQYASHDIGGITRKVTLYALPSLSVADVHALTSYLSPPQPTQRSATVTVHVMLANDGDSSSSTSTVQLTLCPLAGGANGSNCSRSCVNASSLNFPSVPGRGHVTRSANISLQSACPWDVEHPQLYMLTTHLLLSARDRPDHYYLVERTAQKIGIRQVEIAKSQVMVNGKVVKARGTTRHETHAFFGRALWHAGTGGPGTQWREDILAFKRANINWIRTSHYPPAEELMEAADELGMFIELEMPFCWAGGNRGASALEYTIQAQSESVLFNRNHVSVTFWSLANESPWDTNFQLSLRHFIRALDSSRPFAFDGGQGQTFHVDGGDLDIETRHYPGFGINVPSSDHPISFGEYAHLNCYNRRETLTDESVRVEWSYGNAEVWELAFRNKNVLGAFYWAGIDDQFYMPALNASSPNDRHLVGYGPWGLIDNYRREKPECVAARNMYSPVVIQNSTLPARHSELNFGFDLHDVRVENRYSFTDLAEVEFEWTALSLDQDFRVGGTAKASGAPFTSDNALVFTPALPASVKAIELNATFGGMLVNTWHLGSAQMRFEKHMQQQQRGSLRSSISVHPRQDGSITITLANHPALVWTVMADGSMSASYNQKPLIKSGPTLLVLAIDGTTSTQLSESNDRGYGPWTEPLLNWTSSSLFSWKVDPISQSYVDVNITGAYYQQAQGLFLLRFHGNGSLHVSWDFMWTSTTSVNARQIGIVFDLARRIERLSWDRLGQFSFFGPTQIGRNVGKDVLPEACDNFFGESGGACGRSSKTEWRSDSNPLGSNDWRSTKSRVLRYSVCGTGNNSSSSDGCIVLLSNGSHHGRVWLAQPPLAEGVRFLAAVLTNEGGNPFSREPVLPHITVKKGEHVRGSIMLMAAD